MPRTLRRGLHCCIVFAYGIVFRRRDRTPLIRLGRLVPVRRTDRIVSYPIFAGGMIARRENLTATMAILSERLAKIGVFADRGGRRQDHTRERMAEKRLPEPKPRQPPLRLRSGPMRQAKSTCPRWAVLRVRTRPSRRRTQQHAMPVAGRPGVGEPVSPGDHVQWGLSSNNHLLAFI
jgi:hypothetical protein